MVTEEGPLLPQLQEAQTSLTHEPSKPLYAMWSSAWCQICLTFTEKEEAFCTCPEERRKPDSLYLACN